MIAALVRVAGHRKYIEGAPLLKDKERGLEASNRSAGSSGTRNPTFALWLLEAKKKPGRGPGFIGGILTNWASEAGVGDAVGGEPIPRRFNHERLG